MKYILSAKEASEADKNTSDTYHVSPSVLMERAALFTAETICDRFPDRETKVVSCCGKGNNGGDGIAAARILFENGYRHVKLFMPLGAEGLSGSEKDQLTTAKAYDIDISANIDCLSQADIIIDALFGTGALFQYRFDRNDETGDVSGKSSCFSDIPAPHNTVPVVIT